MISSKKVDILLVGGGSGGHLTPLIPIAEALHRRDSSLIIGHVGQKNDPLNFIVRGSSSITQHYEVQAGKYRRFHGEKWYVKILDLKRFSYNLRDMFRVLVGTYQSWRLLGRLSPKVVLAKGGYVGVPVCFAARMRKIPYITHDSDATVSLANTIVSKNATYHTVSQGLENYKRYERAKTIQVGIPVRSQFKEVTVQNKKEAKKELGYTSNDEVLLVLGGGLGAKRVNEAIVASADRLLSDNALLHIVHITGRKLFDVTNQAYGKRVSKSYRSRIKTIAFSDSLHVFSAAADVIVTRAGATTIAELSAQAKACVIVPNPLLTGGHQSVNANYFEKQKAAIVVQESDIDKKLLTEIQELFRSKEKRIELSTSLRALYIPDAADRVAKLLIEVVTG